VADVYPPIKQFETTKFEAERHAQLQLEKREVLSRKATRRRRSWRANTGVLVMRLFGHARTSEQLNPQGCVEPGDS
jgi:hypothetical protein